MVANELLKKRVTRASQSVDSYAKRIEELEQKRRQAQDAQTKLLGEAVLKIVGGDLTHLDELLEWIEAFEPSQAETAVAEVVE